MAMAITIKDVAKRAGVAPSTVSRVIADSPSISDLTKEKVRAIMLEMNYYPNINAQGLASKRSRTLGLVLPKATDAFYQSPFFPTALRGINDAISSKNYSILLSSGKTEKDRLTHIQRIVYGKQVDGLIFLYATKDDPLLHFAKSANCPSVVIGTPIEQKVHSVDNDNEELGKRAAKYLLNQGCKSFAYIGGDMNQTFIKKRYEGSRTALKEKLGATYEPSVYNDVSFLPQEGYDLVMKWDKRTKYDGIIVADELVARGVHRALSDLKIKGAKIVTFKASSEQLDFLPDDIAYFNLNSRLLGQQAVEILFEFLEDDQQQSERYIHEYIDADIINAT